MIALVALAGGIGAAARFLVDGAVTRHTRTATPLGTVAVNTSACLLLGLLTGWLAGHGPVVSVLGIGFLGGYSTFSTASVEAARLFLDGRRSTAAGHALGMLVLGLVAAGVGLVVGSRLGTG
jgi:CrcB protein